MLIHFYQFFPEQTVEFGTVLGSLKGMLDDSSLGEIFAFRFGGALHIYTFQTGEQRLDFPGDILRTDQSRALTGHTFGQDAITQIFFDMSGKGLPNVGESAVTEAIGQDFMQCLSAGLAGPVLSGLHERAVEFMEVHRTDIVSHTGAVTLEKLTRELSGKILEDLRDAKFTVIGDTPAIKPLIQFWSTQDIARLYCVHPEFSVAESLAHQTGCFPLHWKERRNALLKSDVIILDCTDKDAVIVTEILRQNLEQRKHRHLLLMNRGNRETISADISKFPAVFIYNADELTKALAQSRERRDYAIEKLDSVIAQEVTGYVEWLYSDQRYEFQGLVGVSHPMQKVFELIRRVASTDITVLIQGETGTGKELAARAIHNLSQRNNGPFIPVNCGAIPETLLESELFGHKKGAFTGAERERTGLLKEASGGTVFLDEIADTSQMFQVKLLRALQEREITPLGTNNPESIDVRIITASRKDLQQAVNEGQFRSDLFYRINVVRIVLPALRDRPRDILPLARHFIRKYNRKMGKKIQGLSKNAAYLLREHRWDGNVRELENVIERAIALTLTDQIQVSDLPDSVTQKEPQLETTTGERIQTLEEVEEEHITRLLREYEGNYAEVAELLGIGRTTLWRKMKKYGLDS